MKVKQSDSFKLLFILGILWFLFSIRAILTPFILAAILAYILSPLVRMLTYKFNVQRIFSVSVIYILIVILIIVVSTQTGILLAKESRELGRELSHFRYISNSQLNEYPDWVKAIIMDIAGNRDIVNFFTPARLWPYFSGAISGIGSTFIFLVSGFYFLKDGHLFIDSLVSRLPLKYKKNVEEIIKRGNNVLSNYLRGQIFLVVLMASVSWLILALLKVKYALILGIFTGIAETIPIIGPIIAGTAAVSVAIFDGVNTLSLPPLLQGLVIALVYLLLRQMEDVFVIPYVLGKTTKLHPLAVLFAVLIGGHLWGIMGMILAVPFAALVKTVVEFYYSKG